MSRDREVFAVLRCVRHLSNAELYHAAKGRLARSTIRKLRLTPGEGGTMYPRITTLRHLLHAVDKRLVLQIVDADAPQFARRRPEAATEHRLAL